ncbi:MFS transporter [Mycolicibacterium smegmatis]|uniref:MFS transporter n=1 Tax=Mycolicibacterium smegmatis TaxID=1772 RepID=UPI0005D7DB32|nr:MFS transporter [Mycolicibacterium smegmatis]MDF1899667.1 MFS transporter [Mycolicibacterium smegmatis]MDF1905455.1 MFS transporter [Mycolicibacterium smegmatis]MDF1917946.1 MFS transporter [Mycolicibacterium smegmatis]MDF1924498.1 MFS transporter [Mycolicibacterium smegmatis]UGU28947.1 MFS transporter [Mycolicibacterium smegmatis]
MDRLIIRRLMPLLIAAYIIAFIDRTNIGLAKHHLEVDLGISAAAYGLGAGLFFLAYSLCEVPSNLIMHRVGARIWIARIMVTWGLLSAAMAFVQGPASFYVLRILLGAAEAGLFPGVMLYLTYWFGRDQLARANGAFLVAVCLANIVGAPVGGALLGMDGVLGWQGWQWMFVIEGIPAVLLAAVVLKVLPNGPLEAKWLDRRPHVPWSTVWNARRPKAPPHREPTRSPGCSETSRSCWSSPSTSRTRSRCTASPTSSPASSADGARCPI